MWFYNTNNKMKMGYLLIFAGIVLVISGVAVLAKQPKDDVPSVEQVTSEQPTVAVEQIMAEQSDDASEQGVEKSKTTKHDENFTENERKGREFEEYVVRHFNEDYFTIKEWRGDKSVDGRHAEENQKPDIVMTLHLKTGNSDVAVECKWRSSFMADGKLSVTYPEQLDRYRGYARKTGLPVFMVIGVGGKPSAPKEVYAVPLDKIKGATVTKDMLEPYFHNAEYKFYYDVKTKVLR